MLDAAWHHFHWLVSEAAERWLSEASQCKGPLEAASRLRKALPSERVRLVIEQVELRRRGRAKFPDSEAMFFTATGLEQATDAWIAQHKAERFLAGSPVADLCCGIGGDLQALTWGRQILGVDSQPHIALLAAANVRRARHGNGSAQHAVCAGDATRVRIEACGQWHIDPDRRPGGRRTVQAELSRPSFEEIEHLRAANGNCAIKLAPAAVLPEVWQQEAELEWISRARECRQLVAWFGALAQRPGWRRSTVLATNGNRSGFTGPANQPAQVASQLGRYLFEPDPAVLAAQLDGALANEHGLRRADARTAYLTGDSPVADPLLACFEVLEELPFDLKRLKQLCREQGLAQLEVKKRGVELDPERVRRQLEAAGSQAATLLVFPKASGVRAVVARRVTD